MLPFIDNSMYLNALPQNPLYQPYQSMYNYNIASSMLLASQEQMLRSQLSTITLMKAQLLQKSMENNFMYPPQHLTEQFGTATTPTTISPPSIPPTLSATIKLSKKQVTVESNNNICQLVRVSKNEDSEKVKPKSSKEQLEQMIMQILETVCRSDHSEISKLRSNYQDHKDVLLVFDALITKYMGTKKHREDIVRYILRKALKSLKNDVIKKEKVYGKRAYSLMCKKFFQIDYQELERLGVNVEDERELAEAVLPYRRGSKNRTMNADFINKVFSSQEFCDEYAKFLKGLRASMEEDNHKKIQNLVVLAEEAVKNKSTKKIKECTRLPWLYAWMDKTEELALKLPEGGVVEEDQREDVSSEVSESEDLKEVKVKKIRIEDICSFKGLNIYSKQKEGL